MKAKTPLLINDLGLATYLYTRGIQYLNYVKRNGTTYFLFEQNQELDDLIQNYRSGNDPCPSASAVIRNYSKLKAIANEGKRR